MAYGASNIAEGKQDIYYASIGDLNSVAINPIRDTVFMGNQGAYDLWGTLNMAVAGLCIPVSQSVNGVVGASKSVIAKTAAIRIGKEVAINVGIDFASSKVTSFAAQQFNLNKTESTLLNLGLSFGLDKSVDSAKSKILGEASFAEGMSYDDAKRYNDYWKQVESGNNTGYPGLSDVDVKLWKFADNKLNNHIALNKVDFNEVVKLRMEALELENSLRVVDNGAAKAIERAIANGTPKTWKEFLAVNSERSVEEVSSSYIKLIEGQSPWPENFVPQQKILKPGDTFQMALDSTQPVTSPGGFATFDNITNVDYVRNNLAVKSDWKVDCSKVVTYRVKQGVELPVLEGPVGPQIDINAGKYLPGGGSQIQMLLDRSVNKMDYLEVISIRSIN